VNQELTDLLRLYEALQDCPPNDEAVRQDEFKAAVKAFSDANKVLHWRVTAHVVRQWDILCQRENKRKGLDKGSGI